MPVKPNEAPDFSPALSNNSQDLWARIYQAVLARRQNEGLAAKLANQSVKPSPEAIRGRLYGRPTNRY